MDGRTVMDNRLRNFGLGFTIFGFGLNLGVRIATMPPISWQPSYALAVTLLILSGASTAVGLSIIAYSLIPQNFRASMSVTWEFIAAQRQFVTLWIVGLLIVALLGWQSVALYQLQAKTAHRRLSEKQIHTIATALATQEKPIFRVPLEYAADDVESYEYALDLAEAFRAANWDFGITSVSGAHPAYGLRILVRNLNDIPPSASALFKALDNSDVTVSYEEEPQVSKIAWWLYVAPRPN
jgi:hypothetical protein